MKRDRTSRRASLVRTRLRTPDFVRKAGPHGKPKERASRRAQVEAALDEWREEISE